MDEQEITELINKYESDLIKLKFQEEKIKDIIAELRIMRRTSGNTKNYILEEERQDTRERKNIPLKTDEPDTPVEWYSNSKEENSSAKDLDHRQITPPVKKRGRGRPRKPEEEKSVNKVVNDSPSKRERKKGGYQLSQWDKLLLNSLNKQEVMLSSADMFKIVEKYVQDKSLNYNEDQIRGKISRSITKLTKRTDGILRYDSSKKGYVYGLYDWFGKKGEPKTKYTKGL